MKYISYGTSKHDLGLLKEANHDEVIFGHRDFSRFGKLDDEKLAELLQEAQKLNMRTVFEWDILMTENVFSELKEKIVPWLDQFDVLRVQDPGALEWALKNTNRPLQLIAKNATRNFKPLQGCCNIIVNRFDGLFLFFDFSKQL